MKATQSKNLLAEASSKMTPSKRASSFDLNLPSISHLTTKQSPDWGNHQRPWILGGAVATAAAITIGYLLEPDEKGDGSLGKEDTTLFTATDFGILAESSNAVWDSHPIRSGDFLPAGCIKLQSGLAQLELSNGVQITLESESEIELHSPTAITIHSGKVQVEVPKPVIGFQVVSSVGQAFE